MCDLKVPLKYSGLISDYKLKIIHQKGEELDRCADFDCASCEVVFSGALYNYMANALRAVEGEEFVLADNSAKKYYRIRVKAAGKKKITAGFEALEIENDIQKKEYNCFIAVLKGAAGEEAVERLTELGADSIFFFRSRYSQCDLSAEKIERYEKIAMAASSQSRRLSAPAVGKIEFASLREKLAAPASYTLLLAEPSLCSGMAGFKTAGADFYEAVIKDPAAAVNIVSGPEGGFEPGEAESILRTKGANVHILSFKNMVLRAQFAPQAALAVIKNGCGDM
ncbi:MAG: hypothetical protein A2008_04495 [Candidatus Wallbacteria bacterium GWC2_49_35]|uniref:Ribosomal RNA small subunit methyltransferase E n=1 Tax=Candidatus Wallbacteria bacterium GWC2_49_35 TaxID=1817813 RepID=A0A1F7WSZ1_9BACT|nr:MAG: hypothetical protein A2008_04495 [Candidatus Wallbacteria bacterium GWC2_49_35]